MYKYGATTLTHRNAYRCGTKNTLKYITLYTRIYTYMYTYTIYVAYESEVLGLLKLSGNKASYLSAALPFPPF